MENTRSLKVLLALLFTAGLGGGISCDGDVDTPEATYSQETVGLEQALENCEPGVPCPIITYAYTHCLDLVPLTPEIPLGVFDANQGGVATWLTIVVANAPSEGNPYIKLEMETEEGPLNYKEENGPKTLRVPFEALGTDGIRYQDQYMVPFDAVCCASDFEGKSGTLKITITFEGMDPVSSEWPFTLGESPWPEDEEAILVEQCTCDAWPQNIERDQTLCEDSPADEQ